MINSIFKQSVKPTKAAAAERRKATNFASKCIRATNRKRSRRAHVPNLTNIHILYTCRKRDFNADDGLLCWRYIVICTHACVCMHIWCDKVSFSFSVIWSCVLRLRDLRFSNYCSVHVLFAFPGTHIKTIHR